MAASHQFLAWPLLEQLVVKNVLERLGGRLRLCISGGAALDPQIARRSSDSDCPSAGYGMTEASPVVSVNRLARNVPASVGMALPNVEVADRRHARTADPRAERHARLREEPEATAKIMLPDGWLHTGDTAPIDDGLVYITGRLKDIIVMGNGEKVPPVDVEHAIQLDPAVRAGDGGGRRPTLPHRAGSAGRATAHRQARREGDRGACRRAAEGLPRLRRIRRVAIVNEPWTVDNGMVTPTLKLKRAQILERHEDLGWINLQGTRKMKTWLDSRSRE